jgi:cytoskeletal protein CcmA (bactofilin family)
LLELQPKARIEGDVFYKALEMHQGAVIAGQLKPLEEGEKPLLKFRQNAPEQIPEQVAVLLPGQPPRSRYPRSNS